MLTRRSIVKLVILAVAVAAIGVHVAHAAPATSTEGAAAFIKDLGNHVVTLIHGGQKTGAANPRAAAIEKIVRDNVELAWLERFVLGNARRDMTPAQEARFMKVFREFVVESTTLQLGAYRFAHFQVTGSEPYEGSDAMVGTRVERPGEPTAEIDWRVRNEGGRFKIIDVVVENLSMALTERQEFASVIYQKGIAGLVDRLAAKVADLRAAKSEG
jgi:phospholipid transport system substrate-binding protein